jgi:hypothetical protein
MYDRSHDIDRSRNVRLESGCITRVGMYDPSRDLRLVPCTTRVVKCDWSRDIRLEM